MSDDAFSLDEHFRRHVEFPDPWLRIEGLRTARQAIENQLVFLRDQRGVQANAEIARFEGRLHPDDVEDKIDEYTRVVDELFPKILRGGFVISLWSVYESSVKNIGEYVRRQKQLPFGLQELRAGDFLKQVEVFVDRVLSLSAFPDKTIRKELEELKGLRNTLAHHDGSTAKLPESLRSKTASEYLGKGLYVFNDLHHQYIVPTESYTARALDLVADHLKAFAEHAYKSIHPVPLP
ncbi:MAG: hypothetical protein V5B35_01640 [Candidatus Accumulibacter necessarius]|jgi:hypothetical protein|uniref:hypothetical protein n=1 Tax=Candidatus Accumulibacter necessarius TaxID=2954386 RepID=UPI002FC317F2